MQFPKLSSESIRHQYVIFNLVTNMEILAFNSDFDLELTEIQFVSGCFLLEHIETQNLGKAQSLATLAALNIICPQL